MVSPVDQDIFKIIVECENQKKKSNPWAGPVILTLDALKRYDAYNKQDAINTYATSQLSDGCCYEALIGIAAAQNWDYNAATGPVDLFTTQEFLPMGCDGQVYQCNSYFIINDVMGALASLHESNLAQDMKYNWKDKNGADNGY